MMLKKLFFFGFSGYSAHEICKGACPCIEETLIHHTECKTVSGRTCQFPFKANGKIYKECTDDYHVDMISSEMRRYWCATKVSWTRKY